MAYGDYKDTATLQGTIIPNMAPPPGEVADVAWIKNGENAEQTITNRPHQALSLNMDNLKLPLDARIAKTQVAVLTAFSGNTITIDPTGGAADISFSPVGYLYLGNADYAGSTQEHFDTLFQLLDENYNEVIVGGAEVKVSISSVALGSGFYNTGLVTLTLSDTIPSADYRFAYARETTLATLPDDALIRADIRGLHEAAGEVTRKSWWTCGPIGSGSDYEGNTAITDAMDDLLQDATLFVRNGTYSPAASMTLNRPNMRVIGESRNGVHIDLSGGAYDITVSAIGVVLESMKITLQSARTLTLDSYGGLKDVDVVVGNVIGVTQSFITLDNISLGSGRLRLENVDSAKVTNASVTAGALHALDLYRSRCVTFKNCIFNGGTNRALNYYTSNSPTSLSDTMNVTFEACQFFSTAQVVGPQAFKIVGTMTFVDCLFENQAVAAYNDNMVDLLSYRDDYSFCFSGITLVNCRFSDAWSTGHNGAASKFPIIHLENVDGTGIRIDRAKRTSPNDYYNDSPLLRLTDCTIWDLCIFMNGMDIGSGYVLTQTTIADGLILECLSSRVSKLSLFNLEAGDNFGVPLIYMAGDSELLSTGRFSVIEDLEIYQGASYWRDSTIHGALVTMAKYANLHRARVTPGIGEESQMDSLIAINGKFCTVDNCEIYTRDNSETSAWDILIRLGNSCDNARITNNKFYKTVPASYAAIGAAKAVIDAGPTADVYNLLIQGNDIYVNGAVDNVWMRPIHLNSFVHRSQVIHNTVHATITAAGDRRFICVDAVDEPAGVGDLESGLNNVAHNILSGDTAGNIPLVYYGGTACKNDSTNIAYGA